MTLFVFSHGSLIDSSNHWSVSSMALSDGLILTFSKLADETLHAVDTHGALPLRKYSGLCTDGLRIAPVRGS